MMEHGEYPRRVIALDTDNQRLERQTGMRITQDMLILAFNRYVAACTRCGLLKDGQEVHLSFGSPTNGTRFRVNVLSENGGLGYSPAGESHLGQTKTEAYKILSDRTSVLDDVNRHNMQLRKVQP
jgi:hypothetical protein